MSLILQDGQLNNSVLVKLLNYLIVNIGKILSSIDNNTKSTKSFIDIEIDEQSYSVNKNKTRISKAVTTENILNTNLNQLKSKAKQHQNGDNNIDIIKESIKSELIDDMKILIKKSLSELNTSVSVTQIQTVSDKKNENLKEE